MIVVLKPNTRPDAVETLVSQLEEKGFKIHISRGEEAMVLGLVGDTSRLTEESFLANDFVERVMRVSSSYKLASRAFHPDNTIIRCGNAVIGREANNARLAVIAGPCSVESREQLITVANAVKAAGAQILRGGAFKPRTSPYSFQGMGAEGIKLLLAAKEATGLPIVTELMSINQIDLFDGVDIIQIGARNMQNYDLLKEVGMAGKPVLLKRGLSSTVKEFLMSVEYLMAAGSRDVILCERGIRTFDSYTRNTLDISVVPWLQKETHLPVIIDPSHACGMSWMVPTLAKAAVAVGADGIMVEVHNNPPAALCDGEQSLTPDVFADLMRQLDRYAALEGRKLLSA
ncbi:MAG: 3-deoxy-7-phosphoheptulonate synthase [Spirochaetaceae bacterium]|jgi:3-deoxy-7-phosphoheptulonate synthase|nr:3-deoxy-7-phosphoheptulonate synthase [Spirochaetaceae bacterium]